MCAKVYQHTIEQHQRELLERQREAAAADRASAPTAGGTAGSNWAIAEQRAAEERQRAADARAAQRELEQRLASERAAAGTCRDVSSDVMHVAGVLLVPGWHWRADQPDYWPMRVQNLARRHSLACSGPDAVRLTAPGSSAIAALGRCAQAGAACNAAALEAAAVALGQVLGAPLDPCLLDGKGASYRERSWNEEHHSAAGQRQADAGRYDLACEVERDIRGCLLRAANAESALSAESALATSCELLSARGCYELGQLLRDGANGFAPNRDAAALHFLQACRLGWTSGALKTSLKVHGTPAVFPRGTGTGLGANVQLGTLRRELKQSCDTGTNFRACDQLWREYLSGSDGPKDYAAAADLLASQCHAGDLRACEAGGRYIRWGDLWDPSARKPDPQRAMQLYRKGCESVGDYRQFATDYYRNAAIKASCEGVLSVYVKPQEATQIQIPLSDADDLEQIGWELLLPCRLLGSAALCDYAQAINACTFDAGKCLWGQVPAERRQALVSRFRQERADRLVKVCTHELAPGSQFCKEALAPVQTSLRLTGLPPADQEALIRMAWQACGPMRASTDACGVLPIMLGDWQRSHAPTSRPVLDIARRYAANDFFEIQALTCRSYPKYSPACPDLPAVRKLAALAEAEFKKSPITRDGPGGPCKGPFFDGPLPSPATARRADQLSKQAESVRGPKRRAMLEQVVKLDPTAGVYWQRLATERQSPDSGPRDLAGAVAAQCRALDLNGGKSEAMAHILWTELASVLKQLGDPGYKDAEARARTSGQK
jgi:hypothetical protein